MRPVTTASLWSTSASTSAFSTARPLLHKSPLRVARAARTPPTLRQHHRPLSHLPGRLHLDFVPRCSSQLLTPSFRTLSTSPPAMSDAGFYSLKATAPGNKPYEFEQLKGKVVLIVNTASKW